MNSLLTNLMVIIENYGRNNRKNMPLYEVKNSSAIPFDIESKHGMMTIPAESSIILPLNSQETKRLKVQNLFTGSKSNLEVDLL